MADENGTPELPQESKNTTGRTWPDLIAELTTGAPIWGISGAAVVFVCTVAYSAFIMDECRTLAFLGETGACGDRPATTGGELPKSAVVAFAAECPQGWDRYDEAAARIIVGVGSTIDRTGKGNRRRFDLGEIGGTFSYILRADQMPVHTHYVANSEEGSAAINQPGAEDYSISYLNNPNTIENYVLAGRSNLKADVGATSQEGGRSTVDNMPPMSPSISARRRADERPDIVSAVATARNPRRGLGARRGFGRTGGAALLGIVTITPNLLRIDSGSHTCAASVDAATSTHDP